MKAVRKSFMKLYNKMYQGKTRKEVLEEMFVPTGDEGRLKVKCLGKSVMKVS